MATILLVEKTGAQRTSFAEALQKRYAVMTAASGKQALVHVKEKGCHVVVLDAISMRTPGDRIARQLKDGLGAIPLIHLHPENKAASPADVLLYQPFTARKLINTIERLLTSKRGTDAVITAGPFTINTERRLLTANGQETTLTPKLALLVEMFLAHPGETLNRKRLMEQVWHTDYLGDTRTLDVHIRWIRRLIETNPGDPQFLKTVRGVGYRLEVPGTLNNTFESAELTLQNV